MQFNYTIMFCHIPGLVCQDRPPMNIFLEKKDDSIRLVVQSRVVGGRGSGDCRQRVTSGTILQPPAQSPILGGRCHHTSTIEQHPFLFIFFFSRTCFVATRPKTGSSDRERNANCATSSRTGTFASQSSPFRIQCRRLNHIHMIDPIDQPTNSLFFFRILGDPINLEFAPSEETVRYVSYLSKATINAN